jgi:hypothetical protein
MGEEDIMHYHYFDRTTGQYLGTFKGEHCPSNATTTPPPEQSGAWFWTGTEWGNEPQGELPAPTPAEAAKARQDAILSELESTDRFLPRSVEDLLDAGVIKLTDLSQENQDRWAKKMALRDELAGITT